MKFNVGDKVQIIKINIFHRGYLKKYFKRIGTVTEVSLVMPSKRVTDGRIYKVSFRNPKGTLAPLNPQKFISKELRLVG